MPNKHSPLLLKVMARMGDIVFHEAYIPSEKGCDIYGLQRPGEIVINPIPHTVDTIIHEILHDLYPGYSERAVRSMTGKVFKQLSDEEVQAIYEEYKKRTQLSQRLQDIENEKFV